MHAAHKSANSRARDRRGALDLIAFVEAGVKLAGCFLVATLIGLAVLFTLTKLDRTPAPTPTPTLTRHARAEREILVLDRALRLWAAAHDGEYPASLAELLQAGSAFELPHAILNDPWKRPYRLTPSANPEEPPTISSLGLDGREGGEDESADLDNSHVGDPDEDLGLSEALETLRGLANELPTHPNTKARIKKLLAPQHTPHAPGEKP